MIPNLRDHGASGRFPLWSQEATPRPSHACCGTSCCLEWRENAVDPMDFNDDLTMVISMVISMVIEPYGDFFWKKYDMCVDFFFAPK